MSESSTIVRIPFQGHDILAVDVSGKPHIILRPVYEAIGIDADRQIRKVQRQPWAAMSVTAVQVPGDQVRHMVTADMRTFLMSLVLIPVSRVSPAARPVLTAFQCEVADVIEAHWAGKEPVALNVATIRQAVREELKADRDAERAPAKLGAWLWDRADELTN